MSEPSYRILQRTMQGGRVWLIPQVYVPVGSAGVFGWGNLTEGYAISTALNGALSAADMERGMAKALAAIEAHKNKLTAEESVVWPVAGEAE